MLVTFFRNLLSKLCLPLRHLVLDAAHPLPEHVNVDLGEESSIARAIVGSVILSLDPETRSRIFIVDSETVQPRCWVGDHDGTRTVTGCFCIVRYLGRLSRQYPVCPENALYLDESLDQLRNFVVRANELALTDDLTFDSYVRSSLTILDSRMMDGEYLENFDKQSLADTCWRSALKWILRDKLWILEDAYDEFPNVCDWYERIKASSSV